MMDWEETNEDFLESVGLESKVTTKPQEKKEESPRWILHIDDKTCKRTPRLEVPLANYRYRVFACKKLDTQLFLDDYNFKRLLLPRIAFDKKDVINFCKYYKTCAIKKNCEFTQVGTYFREYQQ